MTDHNRAHRQADRAGGLRPEPPTESQPKALIPCAVRRTLKPFSTAPRNGDVFHIISTVRFNEGVGRLEVLVWDGDRPNWRVAEFSNQPTYWLREVPLPYKIPLRQWFTVTYRVMIAKQPLWKRVIQYLRWKPRPEVSAHRASILAGGEPK